MDISRTNHSHRTESESIVKATTTSARPLYARCFAHIWNAASLTTVLPGRGLDIVDTATLSPIPAKAAVIAPHDKRYACRRRRRALWTKYLTVCRCATGCCRRRSSRASSCSMPVQPWRLRRDVLAGHRSKPAVKQPRGFEFGQCGSAI